MNADGGTLQVASGYRGSVESDLVDTTITVEYSKGSVGDGVWQVRVEPDRLARRDAASARERLTIVVRSMTHPYNLSREVT